MLRELRQARAALRAMRELATVADEVYGLAVDAASAVKKARAKAQGVRFLIPDEVLDEKGRVIARPKGK